MPFLLQVPTNGPGLRPEHDIFKQVIKLQNTLRHLMDEDLITPLGLLPGPGGGVIGRG